MSLETARALTYSVTNSIEGSLRCPIQQGRPAVVVTTRWWWVRHAPVREDDGCIYGQKDLGCDTSDRVVFEAVGKILPREAVWVASS